MGWLSKLFNLDDIETPKKPDASPSPTDLKNSKEDARNRLKLVLMHDRTKLAPEMLEKMRDELITVISKYVEIDEDALRLNLETESNTIALVANIPVLRARNEEKKADTTPLEGAEPAEPSEKSTSMATSPAGVTTKASTTDKTIESPSEQPAKPVAPLR